MIVAEFVRLSNSTVVMVPDGADPAAFRRDQEAKLRAKQNPRRKTTRRSRRNSRKTNYAAQVAARGKATLELVERVNGDEPKTDSWWNVESAAGYTASVDRQSGKVSYTDEVE